MDGVYNRNGNLSASWKKDKKTKRFSLLLSDKGNGVLTKVQTFKLAQELSKILKRLDYGELSQAQGGDAVRAIPKLPPNVLSNALRLVEELAWDKGEKKISVREYLGSFRGNALEKEEKARTRIIGRFVEFLGADADEPLESLSKAQCETWILAELIRIRSSTVALYKRRLSHPFRLAVDEGLIPRNPFSNLNVEKLADAHNLNDDEEYSRLPFSKEDIRTLDACLPQDWHDAMVLCLLLGGQRKGDVLTLKWEHVHFDEGTNGVVRFMASKTKRSSRILIIAPMLPKLRETLLRLKEEASLHESGDVYVMPDFAYCHLNNKGNLSTAFTNILKANGILEKKVKKILKGDRRESSEKCFHSFRHFACTVLGVTDAVKDDLERAITGHTHKDVHSTYTHQDEERRIVALEAIAKACGWM